MLKTIGILGVSAVTAAALLTGSAAFAGKLVEPKDIEFKASIDGTAQRYVEMLPEGFDLNKPVNVLICLHGHGSDRWQYVREIRAETKAARDIAAKYNLIYISPDYRAKTSWMGPKAEADMVQIIGLLKAKYKVGKMILNGASMGGSSALTFTAMHPDMIDGVCALNGTANHLEYANFQGAIQESFSGTKAAIPLEYKRRSAEYWPEAFSMPVALTAGGKDASVPPQSVLRLADILKKMGRKVLLIDRPETGHQTDYPDSTAALEFVVCSALDIGYEVVDK
ncbi:MAG: prolyl oligopeptidase family serine peptidase [bacterium]|jgi:pimeloyl-ACP methyl ester carboxylesterase|nr:prolyl oligopeptidase family serine peptidase [bacterium]